MTDSYSSAEKAPTTHHIHTSARIISQKKESASQRNHLLYYIKPFITATDAKTH